MAGEKARASAQITSTIQSLAQAKIQKEHDHQIESIQNELKTYQADVQARFDAQLKREQAHFERQLFQKIALQRYEVQQDVLKYRQELLENFRQSLISDIEAFRQSDAYAAYLEAVVVKHAPADLNCVIQVDNSDINRIQDQRVQGVNLPLGGVKIVSDTKIIDFSYQTRLQHALKTFQEDPKLQIEGGSYE